MPGSEKSGAKPSSPPPKLDDEEIDDETGLDDPEYYLPPAWLRATIDQLAEESGKDE